MDDTDFFPTETITMPIGFRLFVIAILNNRENFRLSGTGTLYECPAHTDRYFVVDKKSV